MVAIFVFEILTFMIHCLVIYYLLHAFSITTIGIRPQFDWVQGSAGLIRKGSRKETRKGMPFSSLQTRAFGKNAKKTQ